jgi:preprotein translocase subunit YajC
MKQKILIFLSIFLVFLAFSLFYYFEFYLPQKRLTEAKKRLEEVQKDIERLKKFDEEKYAEK